MKVNDRVRVIAEPKRIGVIEGAIRAGVWQVKLNRADEGVTHVVVLESELEPHG